MTYSEIIDKYYPAGTRLRDIYITHCTAVADLACRIVREKSLPLDEEQVREAAMLHDIGIFECDAASIACEGKADYICHGVIGAELLRKLHAPEQWARVAERHTGAGLSKEEIEEAGLPLPHRNFLPENQLERLICYADKFFNKSSIERLEPKSLKKVRRSMEKFGYEQLVRFNKLHNEFAIPSLT